jgi:hypothetical protein
MAVSARKVPAMLDMKATGIAHEIETMAVQLFDRSRRDPKEIPARECTCPEFCELDHGN